MRSYLDPKQSNGFKLESNFKITFGQDKPRTAKVTKAK